MRLGKEQSAGYVEDISAEVAEPLAMPVTAEVEPVFAASEPVTVAH